MKIKTILLTALTLFLFLITITPARAFNLFDFFYEDFMVSDDIGQLFQVRTRFCDPDHPISISTIKKGTADYNFKSGGTMRSYRLKSNQRLKYAIGPETENSISYIQPLGNLSLAAGYKRTTTDFQVTLTKDSPISSAKLCSNNPFFVASYKFGKNFRAGYSFQNNSDKGTADMEVEPSLANLLAPLGGSSQINTTTRINKHTLSAEYDILPCLSAGILASIAKSSIDPQIGGGSNIYTTPFSNNGRTYEGYLKGQICKNFSAIVDYTQGNANGNNSVCFNGINSGSSTSVQKFKLVRSSLLYISPTKRWDLSLMGTNYRSNFRLLGNAGIEPFTNIPTSYADIHSFTYLQSDTIRLGLRTKLNNHFNLSTKLQNSWIIGRSYLDSAIFLHAGLPRSSTGETAIDQTGKMAMLSIGPSYNNKDLKLQFTVAKFYPYKFVDHIERWRKPDPGRSYTSASQIISGTGSLADYSSTSTVKNTSRLYYHFEIQYAF